MIATLVILSLTYAVTSAIMLFSAHSADDELRLCRSRIKELEEQNESLLEAERRARNDLFQAESVVERLKEKLVIAGTFGRDRDGTYTRSREPACCISVGSRAL